MIVELFIPCFVDHYFADVAQNTVKVLEHCGCTIHYNESQTCCGRPAIENGHTDLAKEIGQKLIKDLQNERIIVSPSAYCVSCIKNYYKPLFHNSVLHNEYNALQNQVYELADFLVEVLKKENVAARLNGRAWYFETCHAQFDLACNINTNILLQNVEGLELIKFKSIDCCGCGGGLPAHHSSFAGMLANQSLIHLENQQVDFVISNDMQCLQHLKQNNPNKPYKFMHVADVLASGY